MTEAQIELRAKPIDAEMSTYHLFIVYKLTDNDGKSTEYFLRGGPSNNPNGLVSGGVPEIAGGASANVAGNPISDISKPFGNIVTTQGLYTPDSVDWFPNARSSVVIKGSQSEVEPYFVSLTEQMNKVDSAGYRYDPIHQNSNTVAWQSLKNAGLNPTLPKYNDGESIWTPGYNSNFKTPIQEIKDLIIGKEIDISGIKKLDVVHIDNYQWHTPNVQAGRANEVPSFNRDMKT